MNAFIDVETCGLHGVPVLLQYALDDEDIICYDLWLEPIDKTIELLLKLATYNIIGFNLVFDWFHLYKFFTMLLQLITKYPHLATNTPYTCLKELVEVEKGAGTIGCLRPLAACDVMLISKLGPYQSLMDRKNVIIRRVPSVLAERLQLKLEQAVRIDDIYFSRQKKYVGAPRWTCTPSKDKDGHLQRGFTDITLRFKPSGALKVLARHALKIPESDIIQRAEVLPTERPEIDLGYKPYGGDWPKYVKAHAMHWRHNTRAREYASDDVKYTRALWKYFGSPEPGDVDSDLAIMVACVRWRGMKIRTQEIKQLITKIEPELKAVPQAPRAVMAWLGQVMDDDLRKWVTNTKKTTLQRVAKIECDCVYTDEPDCDKCGNTRLHPVALRAKQVLEARMLKKELELYHKLVHADGLYASYRIIGALSGRMAGADRLNVMGIKRTDDVRALFLMADSELGEVLVGGDFDAFEVVLAIADSGDKILEEDVKRGFKIHALFAQSLFPGTTYQDIMMSAGTADDKYTLGKNGVFTMIYGGDFNTLINKYNIEESAAKAAFDNFDRKYPDLARWRREVQQALTVLSQSQLGGRIVTSEPTEFVGSMFGYRRYFILEVQIIKALAALAEDPPREWLDLKIKVMRRADRGLQTAGNATRSALYGAAFSVQSAAQRAGSNHRIQAAGAKITKVVQHNVWRKHQPVGFAPWKVRPLNIHDEILVVTRPELTDSIAKTVQESVESFRSKVPLIKMDWHEMSSWSKNLQEKDVRELREAAQSGYTSEEICVQFKHLKLSPVKVSEICKGKTWRWLPGATS
jgi:DNA polymerase I-like protein with 3'-5' exonuclease and polymerase domains